DIIMIVHATPRPKFIMKSSLKWAPILGWYALRMGCVPVDRGRRAAAIFQMKQGVEKHRGLAGQLIIYPQGTRVAPGAHKPYKIGTAVLYEQLEQECVPAATNVGVFWPRHGFYRKPGLAVVEFLPRLAAGKSNDDFMTELEAVVEDASNRLMAEAGFETGAEACAPKPLSWCRSPKSTAGAPARSRDPACGAAVTRAKACPAWGNFFAGTDRRRGWRPGL
ncbi:MAG: lysophospholipid acyltransferase family protein, partial [Paracoccaceae bacterium]